MVEIKLRVGMILQNQENNNLYRVLCITNQVVVLCQTAITKLNIFPIGLKVINQDIYDHKFLVLEEDFKVIDFVDLSPNERFKFDMKRDIVREVNYAYGPDYLNLMGKSTKNEVNRIIEKYGLHRKAFWRIVIPYLQSGLQDISLVNKKKYIKKHKDYQYSSRPGRKSPYGVTSTIIVNNDIKKQFDEALEEYKTGRKKTFMFVYNRMLLTHYTKIEITENGERVVLLPITEYPTYNQFYYYISKHLSKKDKSIIKNSEKEFRNNKRLLTSDSLNGVMGPGDLVEIDAVEIDLSLVSTVNANQSIGRPIVYAIIDIYSRVIIAISVAIDNNSEVGVTNCFLNLADNKVEYCKKYGIEIEERLWPSGIMPKRIRCDRGSEFTSKEFGRICNELSIDRQIVSGGTGSLKGVVEQLFHQIHSAQNPLLESKGLIEKRYDSNHHKEAILNIKDYTKILINFVLKHNQELLEYYPLTKEMIEQKIKPIPISLWEFGCKKFGQPRPILNRDEYYYKLLKPTTGMLSRKGILVNELYYLDVNNKSICKMMYDIENKTVKLNVKYDPRDSSKIYFLEENRLVSIPLNEKLTGNAEFKEMTIKEVKDYKNQAKSIKKSNQHDKKQMEISSIKLNSEIISNINNNNYASTTNMREEREKEKQLISHKNRISKRLVSENCTQEMENGNSTEDIVEQDINVLDDSIDFKTALEEFKEKN